MRLREAAARPYSPVVHDPVRSTFEERMLGRLLQHLFAAAGGGALLDLGCGDGLTGRLAGPRLTRYLGVDLAPRAAHLPCVAHDLREGLGPVGRRPFDLYLGTFGVASHLSPRALRRLLRDIARHARPGAVVALEALGLYSLEWPRLWDRPPGPARTIPYRLGADVEVHPWSPGELAGMFEQAGIDPLASVDRTIQAGPKLGEGRYWSGLPPLRAALGELLRAGPPSPELQAPLPPLPAGRAALLHHLVAMRRRRLVRASGLRGAELARAIWRIEPRSGGGFGHGMLTVGRVR
jgi:SAM-dependent methyltransferase